MEWVTISEDVNYEISKQGQVRNKRTGKIVKNHIAATGYWVADVCTDYVKKTLAIHVLLAKAFIPNPNNLPVVDHKDGVKTNFDLDNLEWVTYAENLRRAMAMGLNNQGTPVIQYDLNGTLMHIHKSLADAARAVGYKYPSNAGATSIKLCCEGKQHTAKGYRFRYAKEVDSYQME